MRLLMLGCGNMGGAMLRRWLATGVLDPAEVVVVNRHDRALPEGVTQQRTVRDDRAFDVAMLAMKPQQLADVARDHAAALARVPVLVSILAGTDAAALSRAIPGPVPVVTMPSLPVEVGEGVVAVHAPGVADDVRGTVDALMAPLGLVRWFDDAATFRVAGGLSGTGPAFLFRFVDALAAAGVAQGLTKDDAAALALTTVSGAARMVAADARSPAALADAVASPGGMTRAGLNVLDANEALAGLMTKTLAAVMRREEEMAAASRD